MNRRRADHQARREVAGQRRYPRSMTFSSPAQQFATRVRTKRAVLATISALTVAALWFLAVANARGQLIDNLAMQAIRDRMDLWGWPSVLLSGAVSEAALIIAAVVVAAVAAARRRVALGVRAVLVLAAANIATQLLKVALERPQLEVGHALENSFPSGHVTAVAAALVALVAVVPTGVRGWVSFAGFVLTSAVSVAVIALGWHRPSDVVAALAVVLFFAMLGLPAELVRGRGSPWAGPVAFAGLVVSAALVAIAALRTPVLEAPVTQARIVELSATAVPGALLAVASCALVVSACGVLFASVDSLMGDTAR